MTWQVVSSHTSTMEGYLSALEVKGGSAVWTRFYFVLKGMSFSYHNNIQVSLLPLFFLSLSLSYFRETPLQHSRDRNITEEGVIPDFFSVFCRLTKASLSEA
jgi:hypothetical protein